MGHPIWSSPTKVDSGLDTGQTLEIPEMIRNARHVLHLKTEGRVHSKGLYGWDNPFAPLSTMCTNFNIQFAQTSTLKITEPTTD